MLQQAILRQYQEHFPGLTYRAIAEHTGIQLTRIFRIINGSEMKLREYEIFYLKLQECGAVGERLSTLSREAEKALSSTALQGLCGEVERRLKLAKLIQTVQTSQQICA